MPTLIEIAVAMGEASDAITNELQALLARRGFDPSRDAVLVPVMELHRIVLAQATAFPHAFSGWFWASRMAPSTAMRWLHALGNEHLIKCSYPYRGAIWSPNDQAVTQYHLWQDRPRHSVRNAS